MKYIKPNWPAPENIQAYTTTKAGWSNVPYAREHVTTEESRHISTLLNLPEAPRWLNQTHTSRAVAAQHIFPGMEADASYTQNKQEVCVVMTADCLPVFITDKEGSKVAAIHAGWRGLANDILENTLQELKLAPEAILVWFGPAIGPEKFEVGQDVYEAFVSRHQQSAMAFFKLQRRGKWLADLYTLAKIRLQLQGIHNIYGGGYCTYSQEELFFSYRRDGKNTGRMASLIWISDVQ